MIGIGPGRNDMGAIRRHASVMEVTRRVLTDRKEEDGVGEGKIAETDVPPISGTGIEGSQEQVASVCGTGNHLGLSRECTGEEGGKNGLSCA